MQGKSGSYFEYRVISKEGETKWVSHSWSPIFENGKVKLVSSVIRDITERKKLENDLRASEEKFRAMSNSAMDAIVLVDDEGNFCYWNNAAERIFGYTQQEVMGKNMEIVLPLRYKAFSSNKSIETFIEKTLKLQSQIIESKLV